MGREQDGRATRFARRGTHANGSGGSPASWVSRRSSGTRPRPRRPAPGAPRLRERDGNDHGAGRAVEETDLAGPLSPGAKLASFLEPRIVRDFIMENCRSVARARVLIGSALAVGMLLFPRPSSGQVAGQVPPPKQPPNNAPPRQGTADRLHADLPAARGPGQRAEGRRPNARRGGSQGDHRGDPSGRPSGPSAVDPKSGGWLGQFLQDRFDLRLMYWGDGSGVPTSGNKLVIIGIDNNDLLHIRIFDAGGKGVMDSDETKLSSAQAVAISTLKHELPDLLPPHELTGGKKARVIRKVRSIVGREDARRRLSQAPPRDIPRRSRTTRSRSRRDAGSSPGPGLTEANEG